MTVGMCYKVTLATGTGRHETFDYEFIQPAICEDSYDQAKEIARHYRADTEEAGRRWRVVSAHLVPNPLTEVM